MEAFIVTSLAQKRELDVSDWASPVCPSKAPCRPRLGGEICCLKFVVCDVANTRQRSFCRTSAWWYAWEGCDEVGYDCGQDIIASHYRVFRSEELHGELRVQHPMSPGVALAQAAGSDSATKGDQGRASTASEQADCASITTNHGKAHADGEQLKITHDSPKTSIPRMTTSNSSPYRPSLQQRAHMTSSRRRPASISAS